MKRSELKLLAKDAYSAIPYVATICGLLIALVSVVCVELDDHTGILETGNISQEMEYIESDLFKVIILDEGGNRGNQK